MRDPHAPDDQFVERLEWQIAGEARRRRAADVRSATPWSRWKLGLAAAGLMLVSMGIGAAAAGAAYQAQDNERRGVLVSAIDRQLDLAKQRVAIANEELTDAERSVAVGTASPERLLDGRLHVAEAQAQVKSLELELQEVRLTSRDARNEASAPLVSGRDFVTDRLRVDLTVRMAALDRERTRMRDIESRINVGMAPKSDLEEARVRTLETDAAIDGIQRKIEIRRKFLAGQMDAVEAELSVREGEAEQRQRTLAPRIELARQQLAAAQSNFDVGRAQSIDVARAKLRLQEFQTEMAKAELDVQLIRRLVEQRRTGR